MQTMGMMRAIKGVLRALLLVVACFTAYVGVVYVTGNFHTVISGQLYRSGQPSAEQIADWHERYGIKTIINLRGAHPNKDWYRVERATAREYGVELIDYRISAKRELTPAQLEELLAILAQAKPPVLIHCLDGADRAGLVSAFYVAGVAKGSEYYAELQLTPLYGHIPLWFAPYYAMDRSFENAEPRLGFPDS
jgi:protein tyrosine/serine phosphatase